MTALTDDRKLNIIELLAGKDSISVKELSQELKVSEVTIRADLDALEESGKVVRFHGGARLAENRYKQEFNFQTRKALNLTKKTEIGKAAAAMVVSNESVLIDASTTALAAAQALRRRDDLFDVTVMPVGIWTAIELMGCINYNVLLPGGYLRHTSGSITGLPAQDFFDGLIIQKAFLGAWGVSAEQGFTDSHLLEVELKKAVISRAKEIIILADGSKFQQTGLASYATIGQVTMLITDSSAPADEVEKIRKMGVEVVVVTSDQ